MNKEAYITISSLLILFLANCSTNDEYYKIKGIGSIEHNDSTFAIHYYNNKYILNETDANYYQNIKDSSRVIFSLQHKNQTNDTPNTYLADAVEISEDIRQNVIYDADSCNNWIATCQPCDIHITRDFRRLDYFNITTYYYTKNKNDDRICLSYHTKQQIKDTVVLWLRHNQKQNDSLTYIEYNTISVPLNIFMDENKERINIKLLRLNATGDTLSENYIYSYQNKINK